jgi:MFS family permease
MIYGGVVADRMNRRNLILITQTSMMILAFILSFLTFLNIINPWQIIVLASLLGIANAFDAPARQSFILEMVDRNSLTNAIALNSTMFNLSMAFGPAIGGLLYSHIGPGWCFLINAVSFIAIIIALFLMKFNTKKTIYNNSSSLVDIKNGFKYVIKEPVIITLILLVGSIGLLALSLLTLLPAWSVIILKSNAKTYGFLFFFRAIGMLLGSLLIASFGHFKFRGKLLSISSIIFPITLFIFAFINYIPLSMFVIFLSGIFTIFVLNLANSLVQTRALDQFRGRVMGIYSLIFFGVSPLGSLFSGLIAKSKGEQFTFIIFSSLLFLFIISLLFFQPHIQSSE